VAAAAVLNMLWQAAGAAAVEPPPNITVREERGVYSVAARFLVDQPPSVALTVLTDYEQIPRFMPDIRTSRVRERGRGRAVVEQEAVAHVMLFTKRVHLVLEIDEQPDALIFRDRCGLNFARYEGAWRFSQQNGRTTIAYELIAEPSFDVPGFMLKRLFRRDAGQMIEGLKREIAARAASPAGVTPQSLK
jgi:ribosome-associated toxin RatA of RatAB toxin-antitoxin module